MESTTSSTPTNRSTATDRSTGIALAAVTAVVSGVAVFINGYGVRAWKEVADTATYTTFKNLVAAATLIGVVALVGRRNSRFAVTAPTTRRHWVVLGVIAVVGGSVPFLLFFEGLARATSGQAAFIHKTLVIWVTILAVAFLKERIGPIHLLAVVLLVWGQATLLGGLSGLSIGSGELMMGAATLLWSVEVVVAKRLLTDLPPMTLAIARMAGGAVVLIAYAMVTGAFSGLGGITMSHIGWVLLTGLVLSVYVGTWFAALARAQAVDVTAVLVAGALITAALNTGVRGLALPEISGLGLLGAGVVLVMVAIRNRTMVHQV